MHVSKFSGITEPLLKIQQQLTTMKRINRPSDDPPAHGQVLRYDKRLSEADQHLRNIDVANFYMSSSESALKSVQQQLAQARRLAHQAAGTTSPQAFSAAALEAKAIYDQILALSNTYTGGRFIFAGQHEKTSPFSMQGSVMRSFIGSDLGYVGTKIDPAVAQVIIGNQNNQLTLTTRGGTFGQVTIPVGTYTRGAQLAAAIQSAIDNAPEFRGAGRLLTVAYEGDHLVIRSRLETATSIPPPRELGLGLPAVFDSANNKLTLTPLNGSPVTVTVPLGTYKTSEEVAAAVQSEVNKVPALARRTIAVQFDTVGRLVVRMVNSDSKLETEVLLLAPVPSLPVVPSSPVAPLVSGSDASVIAVGGSAAEILRLANGTNEPDGEFIGTGPAANNFLTVSIDGKVSKTVTIPPGKYRDGVTLANIVQSAINTDPDVAAANVRVTVEYDDDHRLVITSNSTDPSASSVLVRGGTASDLLGLSGGSNRPVIEYLGDGGEIPVIIGPRTVGVPGTATTVISNLPGDRLFLGSAGGVDVLATVGGLQAALEKGNSAGIQQALYDLDSAQKQVSHEQTVVGMRQNTVDLNQLILKDFKVAVSGFRSDIQDTQYDQALSDMTSYMNALQAAAQVEGRILENMSLLEFLE